MYFDVREFSRSLSMMLVVIGSSVSGQEFQVPEVKYSEVFSPDDLKFWDKVLLRYSLVTNAEETLENTVILHSYEGKICDQPTLDFDSPVALFGTGQLGYEITYHESLLVACQARKLGISSASDLFDNIELEKPEPQLEAISALEFLESREVSKDVVTEGSDYDIYDIGFKSWSDMLAKDLQEVQEEYADVGKDRFANSILDSIEQSKKNSTVIVDPLTALRLTNAVSFGGSPFGSQILVSIAGELPDLDGKEVWAKCGDGVEDGGCYGKDFIVPAIESQGDSVGGVGGSDNQNGSD